VRGGPLPGRGGAQGFGEPHGAGMIIQAICFYLFAAITIASAVMVISARNPVHSVLFLILAFFNAAALFILLGAEFLGMILIVVYLGAVTVLFLFVVMMLDINVTELRQGFLQYLPIGGLIGLILLAELVLVLGSWVIAPGAQAAAKAPIPPVDEVSNTAALGNVLYTDYIYLFQASGIVLLVAMVGAIVLTLRSREGVRRQSIRTQNLRSREQSVEIKKVQSGSSV
jgi:NADH-quinone oxidoreductase subunit J